MNEAIKVYLQGVMDAGEATRKETGKVQTCSWQMYNADNYCVPRSNEMRVVVHQHFGLWLQLGCRWCETVRRLGDFDTRGDMGVEI